MRRSFFSILLLLFREKNKPFYEPVGFSLPPSISPRDCPGLGRFSSNTFMHRRLCSFIRYSFLYGSAQCILFIDVFLGFFFFTFTASLFLLLLSRGIVFFCCPTLWRAAVVYFFYIYFLLIQRNKLYKLRRRKTRKMRFRAAITDAWKIGALSLFNMRVLWLRALVIISGWNIFLIQIF